MKSKPKQTKKSMDGQLSCINKSKGDLSRVTDLTVQVGRVSLGLPWFQLVLCYLDWWLVAKGSVRPAFSAFYLQSSKVS